MIQETKIINGIEFTDLGTGRSRCEFCKKEINNMLLSPHSMVHRHELRPARLPQTTCSISATTQTHISEIILDQCNRKESSPQFLEFNRSSQENQLKVSLIYIHKMKNHINRLAKNYERCEFIQILKNFRKWKKINN